MCVCVCVSIIHVSTVHIAPVLPTDAGMVERDDGEKMSGTICQKEERKRQRKGQRKERQKRKKEILTINFYNTLPI